MLPSDPETRSWAGSVLAASVELLDPNFHQGLVFLVAHDVDGALGLVLNRPLATRLDEVVSGPGLPEEFLDSPVYVGGPVKPTSLLLASFEIHKNRMACQLMDDPAEADSPEPGLPKRHVRAFLGYAGWGEGQLEEELAEGSWKICRPTPALFQPHLEAGLWNAMVGPDQRWRAFWDRLPADAALN